MPNNLLGILNKYRIDNNYEGRIGEITQYNLNNITHEFTGKDLEDWLDLMNQIARTYVRSQEYSRARNPFASYYREPLPVGSAVREIWVDVAEGYDFPKEGTARGEIASVKPNTAETFYNINYAMQYKITYSEDQIRKFFNTLDGLDSFNSQVMRSVYTAAEYDNFLSDCQVFGTALYQGGMVFEEVGDPTDENSIKSFMLALTNTLDNIKFMSRNYNAAGFLMASSTEDLVLITTPEVLNTITIQWLAGVFNVDLVKMRTKIITVPKTYGYGATTDSKNVVGILMDRRFLHIQEQLYTTSVNFIHGPRYYNMFHTQSFIKSFGMFVPCIAFVSSTRTADIEGGIVTTKVTNIPGTADVEVTTTSTTASDTLYLEFEGTDVGTFSGAQHNICTYIELPASARTSATRVTVPSFPWKNAAITNSMRYSRDKQDSQHWQY